MQDKHHQEEHSYTQGDVQSITYVHGAIVETDLFIENFATVRAVIMHFGKVLPERIFVDEEITLVAFRAFIIKNGIELGTFQHNPITLL